MKTTLKKQIPIYICCVLMFFWIFLTVFLTGGRETYEFNQTDNIIFLCFIIVEILTLIGLSISLTRFIRTVSTSKNNKIEERPLGKYQLALKRRGSFLMRMAFMLALLFMLFGICLGADMGKEGIFIVKIVFTCSFFISVLMIPANIYFSKIYTKKFNQMKVEEIQQFIIGHRESAEEIADDKLGFIRKCRFWTDFYALIYFVFAAICAFGCGMLFNEGPMMAFYFAAVMLFAVSIYRIRFNIPKEFFADDKTYVSYEEFPEIYDVAKRAAQVMDCKGKIRIALLDDFNAGIAKVRENYSIQLGAVLLNILSKEELYNVLLHEFAHIANDTDEASKENLYYYWLTTGKAFYPYSNLASLFYLFADMIYSFHFSLYRYAISIVNEMQADAKMSEYGESEYAASALLKMKYHDFYLWEEGTNDKESIFAPEQLNESMVHMHIKEFKTSVQQHHERWNQMIESEILSRSATHPTLNMRLRTLGVENCQIKESDDSESYKYQCMQAADYVGNLIYQEYVNNYETMRQDMYLEPKRLVDQWQDKGKC